MNSSMKMSKRIRRRRACSGCLRYLMIIANILFGLLALALIAVFIYISIYWVSFVKAVLGTDLVIVAAALLVAAGCLLFVACILGCIAAGTKSFSVIIAYTVLIGLIFLILFSSIICILVFRTWLTEQVRTGMEHTLTTYYGVDLDKPWNRQVTESWDRAQSMWQCCSVRDNSWSIYWLSSNWFRIQPGVPGGSGGNAKRLVPASCCVTDSAGKVVNNVTCQTTMSGPPFVREVPQYGGNTNKYLYYRGCYESSKDHLINEVSWYIMGAGIGVAFFMILGLTFSITLALCLRFDIRKDAIMMSSFETLNSLPPPPPPATHPQQQQQQQQQGKNYPPLYGYNHYS